jgi:hypothetical protein
MLNLNKVPQTVPTGNVRNICRSDIPVRMQTRVNDVHPSICNQYINKSHIRITHKYHIFQIKD